MITVGLDLSLTHTGYVAVDDSGIVLVRGVIKSKPSGDTNLAETQRIVKISDEVLRILDDEVGIPDLVVIEGLAFMAQGTSLVQLAGLNYIIRSKLAERTWPFMIVAPTTLKKFITGSGKGDKDMMLMEVFKNYGFSAMDNNECDAYSLAVAGMAVLGKPLKKSLKAQEEVIKLLKKQI